MESARSSNLQAGLEKILSSYLTARDQDSFGRNHELWSIFESVKDSIVDSLPPGEYPDVQVTWSMGQGNWSSVPWIAFLDSRETTTTQKGTYCCFLFRQDMTGVYLTYNQGVRELQKKHGRAEAREILRRHAKKLRERSTELMESGFKLDDRIDLRAQTSLGKSYEESTIAYKLYETDAIPPGTEILQDIDAVLQVYDSHVGKQKIANRIVSNGRLSDKLESSDHRTRLVDALIQFVSAQGFVFEPWQIAAYCAALRTKPFVILAGVSGTGKSKLPGLVAEGIGGKSKLIPVRPDWTDSSDVLGYEDLQGEFRPGPLLTLAREAKDDPQTHFTCIADEMNLARVEYYFAEVLSRIEDRRGSPTNGYSSSPLLNLNLRNDKRNWQMLGLPPNLAIVGTVNMDETTHGFSRKVLDRAFTIELSDIDLAAWNSDGFDRKVTPSDWPINGWYPRAIQLDELQDLPNTDRQSVDEVIDVLTNLNSFLVKGQLQIGYRVRDEIALFVLHANEIRSSFVSRADEQVNPLDLALHMKVLPRIVGGSNAIRRILLDLLGYTINGKPLDDEPSADSIRDDWDRAGRSATLNEAAYPRTAARLCLMWDRLRSEGFTSYWL